MKDVLFHVDMIGEGIDVPGITGVMPFRNCELCKFVQNIGRSSRLNVKDRERYYAGEIKIEDRIKDDGSQSTWIKPCSWVIVPTFLANSEGFSDRFRNIIERLKKDYGFIPSQNVLIDNVNGLEEDKDIDFVNSLTKIKRKVNSKITGFTHEFDDLTPLEKVLFDDAVAKEKEKISDFIATLFLSPEKTVTPGNLAVNSPVVDNKGL